MNDFEKLLHGVLDRTDTFLDASYTGRACYARLSNDLRVKAEFIYTSVKDHYNRRFRINDGMCCQVRSWQRKLYAECCHRVYYPLDPGSIRQGHWVSGARCS